MIVVDASVWIGSALPIDEFHARSRVWLDGRVADGEPLGGPTLVLAEVSGAIAGRSGNTTEAIAAVRRLESTPSLRLVPMETALVREAAQLAADLHLRGADAIYVATAVRLGCPLVTWDDELIRKSRGTIEARHPTR